ncbi:MAG: carbohydrate ABC transporter permease [Firmicutes bacterium]|jgi:multiple sugar transport system permease protein|nr:carbohydrate ABC transporter permease [Bacillota bacterium]NLL88814.1 carbohydrate ABC transporter permease [Bacillota bacterium]HKM17043.1 carbohydrate ABC transporter permease [Limnochordia bacterium]
MGIKTRANALDQVRYKHKFRTSSFWVSTAWSLIRGVLVAGICFIIVYPVLIKISSSLMTEEDLFDLTVRWIPKRFSMKTMLGNYADIYREIDYLHAFANSAALALTVAVLQAASCTLVGYGLARFKFLANNLLFALVIFTLLVPPQMVTIPLFLNFRFFDLFGLLKQPLNLIGTFWPFVLTSMTGMGLKNGLFIYIMRQFFKGMPKSLEEAALVDGAGHLRTFFAIMLPGAKVSLLIVFLFSFVWQYNDMFLTQMYMQQSSVLLPFRLESLTLIFDNLDYSDEYISIILNTGMVMFITPILIMYAFLQRYFIESVERTGIVG